MSQVINTEDFGCTYFKATPYNIQKFNEITKSNIISILDIGIKYFCMNKSVLYHHAYEKNDIPKNYKEITCNQLTGHFEHVEDDKYKIIPIETYNNMIKQVNLLADKFEDQKKFIMKYIDLSTTERDELEELRTLKKLLDNDDTTIKQTLQRVEKVLK